ncbi:hypothetical protein [Comamonas testosteroni]|uniref:hypothetical protein n=1 Tax=Comamonas testosteroni TaxID=285 RepID=UPI0006A62911|nr:hypothetical protein [Comamonas testosteroni]
MTDTTKRITQLTHLSKAQNTALAAVVEALKGLPPEDAQEVLDHAAEQLAGDDLPPMFARGIAGPLGKLICAVKTKIDDVTYGLWLQYCAARGLDTREQILKAGLWPKKLPLWQGSPRKTN